MQIVFRGANSKSVNVNPKQAILFDVLGDDGKPISDVLVLYPTEDSVIILPTTHRPLMVSVAAKLAEWANGLIPDKAYSPKDFAAYLLGEVIVSPPDDIDNATVRTWPKSDVVNQRLINAVKDAGFSWSVIPKETFAAMARDSQSRYETTYINTPNARPLEDWHMSKEDLVKFKDFLTLRGMY